MYDGVKTHTEFKGNVSRSTAGGFSVSFDTVSDGNVTWLVDEMSNRQHISNGEDNYHGGNTANGMSLDYDGVPMMTVPWMR